MKKIIAILALVAGLFSCGTDYNYVDTGKVDLYFKGDMYEYLKSSSYNWDSVRLMVERADLVEMFKSDDITFLGITNHTIRKWLISGGAGFNNFGYKRIDDIPVSMCRTIVLSHVIQGKILRDDVERVVNDEKGNHVGGGRRVVTLNGNRVWLWTKQDKYMGVQGMGPVTLFMVALKSDNVSEISKNQVASTNIQPTNGVVQALEYNYKIEDIGTLTIQ